MLKFSSTRKNKIDLNDYDYRSDIENRLFMSSLSAFEVEVLEEILHSSLTMDVETLAEAVEATPSQVIEVVDKLQPTGLVKRQEAAITVDKERRKYYDFQIRKFDDNFKPNLQFVQGLLSKVPIHILPQWYAIPRASSNIFESIVEKYVLTPRVFQRYLLELNLGDPIIQGMLNDVFSAPDFKMPAAELQKKYQLDAETFEEYMLHLEFNLLCCLSYNEVDGEWKQVVTAFHEWRQHLRFLRDTMPEAIAEETAIGQTRPGDLAFAHDFHTILTGIAHKPLRAHTAPAPFHIQTADQPTQHPLHPDYLSWHLHKLHALELIAFDGDWLKVTEAAQEWLPMTTEDVALTLYRHPKNQWREADLQSAPRIEREFREVERSLERIADHGWVRFGEFIKGVMAAVRGAQEVTLQQVGRRWAYTRPTYTPDQVAFIRDMIFERFFEAGFVAIGSIGEEICFKVSPFGRSILAI